MYRSYGSPRYRPPPSLAQIVSVAGDVVSTLQSVGVDACFVGGMACNLLGVSRMPNDLDILCLTTAWAQEALKAKLVALNSHFYLVPSRDFRATYKVLWYRITETDSCFKVDILLPGILDIPHVPLSTIDYDNRFRLPCAPFSLVLLLKLQAWVHHGESILPRFREKQPTDVRDINELLSIACNRGVRPRTEFYLHNAFISLAELRVEKYVEWFPETKNYWVTLGFAFVQPERKSQGKMQLNSDVDAYTRYNGRKIDRKGWFI